MPRAKSTKGIKGFQANVIENSLLNEIQTLRKELIQTRLISRTHINVNTIIVYSALKSGFLDEKVISDKFLLSRYTVAKELSKLAPIRFRKLHIYQELKTKPKITIGTTNPDSLNEKIIFEPLPPDLEPLLLPKTIKDEKPLDKKSKLLKMRM